MVNDITSVAQNATSITTILGVVGLIIYVILYSVNKGNKNKFSPEIIAELKKHNIASGDLAKLSDKQLRLVLASHNSLSKELIKGGINKETQRSLNFLKYTVSVCFVLAVFFGVVWYKNEKSNSLFTFRGTITDPSLRPLSRAKVNYQDQLQLNEAETDSKGLFSVTMKNEFVTLCVSKAGYDTTWHTVKLDPTTKNTDTIILKPRVNHEIRLIKGSIYDDVTDKAISNATITLQNDSGRSISRDVTGYFELYHTFNKNNVDDITVLKVIARGYKPFSKHITRTDLSQIIYLKR